MTEIDILPKNKEGKEAVISSPFANKSAKEGSFTPLIIFMIFTLIFAGLWDKVPAIKKAIHFALDPSAGALLNWNLNLGMLIVVLIITVITRVEQKDIQKQMKESKDHPEKVMELQKKQFAMMPKQMKLSMRAVIYTGIPFVLFFRWFNDYFIAADSPRFLLGLTWFWFYLIFAMIFSSILRKWWDVV